MKNSFKKFICPGLIGILGTLCYFNVLDDPFVFDDLPAIVNNETLRDLTDWWTIGSFYPTRFITMLSLAMNYQAGHYESSGYHLVNLIIHICAALSVYALVYQLFLLQGAKGSDQGGIYPKGFLSPAFVAFLSALMFTLHPLQTQAVTYTWQRTASLACFFYVTALAFHLGACIRWRTGGPWKRFQAAAYLLGLCSMLSKQTGFTLPPAAFTMEALVLGNPFGRMGPRRTASLVWLLMLCVIPVVQMTAGDRAIDDILAVGGPGLTPPEYFFTQINVVRTYILMLLLPFNQNLDCDYPLVRSLFARGILISLIVHGFLLSFAWGRRKQDPVLSMGIIFFYLGLSVESSLVPLRDVFFEHRLYLPLVGFALVAASVLGSFPVLRQVRTRSWSFTGRNFAPHFFMTVLFCMTVLTLTRNRVWRSEESLWASSALLGPGKRRPNYNYGRALMKSGKYFEAGQALLRAEKAGPKDASTQLNLGIVFAFLGQQEPAMAHFTKALKLRPESSLIHENLGVFYARMREWAKAEDHLLRAIEKNPKRVKPYLLLGVVLLDKGDYPSARKVFNQALQLKSRDALIFRNAGNALSRRGFLELAGQMHEKCLEIQEANKRS